MIGIEQKFKISQKDAKKIRNELKKLGAWPQEQIETTSVFDDDGFSFLKEGKTLRKRLIHLKNSKVRDLLFVNSALLDFKDSSENDEFNEREEISVELADFRDSPKLLSLLLRQGYRLVLVYEKERENWLGLESKFGVNVSIDRLAELSCFLEIEGKKEKIKEMVKVLGLGRKKNIRKITYQLYSEFLKRRGKSFDGAYNLKLKKN